MLEKLNRIQSYSLNKSLSNIKLITLKVKKEEQIKTAKVISIKREFSNPFIGREYELSELKQKYFTLKKRITPTKSFYKQKSKNYREEIHNKPMVVGIKGEAGLGKTRLVREFLKSNGKYSVIGQAESFVQSPYSLFLSIIKSYCGILQMDSHEVVKNKLKNSYNDISNYLENKSKKKKLFEGLNIINYLLGIRSKDSRLILSSNDLKLHIQISLREFIESISAKANFYKEPLILVLEDAHWIDAASKNAFSYILNTIKSDNNKNQFSANQILFLLLYRPVFTPGYELESSSDFSEIELTSLDNASVEKMLLQTPKQSKGKTDVIKLLTEKTLKEVSERSEGNPLFIQEWSKLIRDKFSKSALQIDKDGKIIFDDTNSEIPETINTLIKYRINNLTSDEKEIIQTASVIGFIFSANQIGNIFSGIGKYSDIKKIILKLEEGKFIRKSEEEPGNYTFIHNVIQEIVYNTITEENRKILHYSAAEMTERLFSENISQHYYSLAEHYSKSDAEEKAIEYFEKAGDKARESFENEKAIEYYDKILESKFIKAKDYQIKIIFKKLNIQKLIGKWESAIETCLNYSNDKIIRKDTKTYLDFSLMLAEILHYQSNYSGSIELLKRILKIIKSKNEEKYLETLSFLCMNYIQAGILDKAEEYCDILFRHSKESNINLISAKANNFLGQINGLKGNLKKSISYYEKSLRSYEESGDLFNISLMLNRIGIIYTRLNDYKKAIHYYEKANQIACKIGDLFGYSMILGNTGNVYYNLGKKSEALKQYKKQLEVTTNLNKKDGIIQSYINLGNYFLSEGNYSEALNYYFSALKISEEIKRKQSIANIKSNIGLINYFKGNYGEALDNYYDQLLIDESLLNKEGIIRGNLNVGNLYKKMSNLDNAEQCYLKAIAMSKELESKRLIALSHFNYAEFLFELKKFDEAEFHNNSALGIFNPDEFKDDVFEFRLLERKIYFYNNYKNLSFDLEKNYISLQRNNLKNIILETEAMINEAESEIEKAKVHFEIWKMKNQIKEENMKADYHKKLALKIFQGLYKKTPNIEFKSYILELTLF
ncbi:MAG: tetratricopeptide repeat protein [bacterium]